NKNLKSIAVVGPLADDQRNILGSWTGDGRAEDAVTLLAGIKIKVGNQTKINYAKGCEIRGDDTKGFAEALRAARDSEAVVVAVGEDADMSGEAASRSSLDLPGRQLDLVKELQ